MKRKLVRQGGTALTVTLPARWVKDNNLKPGDEVFVLEEGSNIHITVGVLDKRIKSVTLAVDGLNNLTLNRHLDEFYRLGAQEIILTFQKGILTNYKDGKEIRIDVYIKEKIDRFIGVEVFSQTSSKMVLQSLLHGEDLEKVDTVRNRIFFLIKELLDEFVQAMDHNFSEFNSVLDSRHENITKFINYYLRLLNFSKLPEEQKSRMFSLFTLLGLILDKIRHTSRRVNEMKRITDKVKQNLISIFNFFIEQFDAVLQKNYSLEDLGALIKKRYDIVHVLNQERFTLEESKVILESNLLLNTINEFTTCFAALNLDRYITKS